VNKKENKSMNTDDLYHQRLTRILKTVALEEPDRTPVVLEYSGFAAYVTRTPMAEFLRSSKTNIDTMIQAFHMVGDADAINYGAFWPYGLCYAFMSKVRVPGVDLAENEMWQVTETELMNRDDYDRIRDLGWSDFFKKIMQERILNDAPAEYFPPKRKSVNVRGKWQAHGIPVLSGGDVTTPIELLCGARSLIKFAMDLVEIPDTIEAVMDIILPHLANKAVQRAKNLGYPLVWIGGWRSAPCLISPTMWNRFAWPYFRKLVFEVVDAGLIALLHLDSDWTRELERFRELPRGKCIMALDGETDIFKAKEVLADHMCVMGDVPASMLFLKNPEEVYAYCSRLIRQLGPQGFMLQSGCDIPANAKLENVQAMVAAAVG
jgi:hypothetical protein